MRLLIKRDILFHHLSAPVLDTGLLNQLKEFKQHGKCTCYDHSIAVAKTALFLSMILPFRFKQKQLVRGALLHDYFLYDWHNVKLEKLHGFHHPRIACENAKRDFDLTVFVIEHHMDLVMGISDRIYVVEFGKLIAEGTPQEIQNNQAVIDAYLGGNDE